MLVEFVVHPREGAVRDAITLLARTSPTPNTPTFLLYPKSSLHINLESLEGGLVTVTCPTWHKSVVTLMLIRRQGMWVIDGPAAIAYDHDYPIRAYRGKRIGPGEHTIRPRFTEQSTGIFSVTHRIYHVSH